MAAKGSAVNESIAEGLSVVGLVVGFPLLLLVLMLSLEKLESWGLRSSETERASAAHQPDRIDAAVDEMEQLSVASPELEQIAPAGDTTRSGS